MKSCKDCVSRYLCFLAKKNEGCLGHNDKDTFWNHMRLNLPFRNIDKMRKMIEEFQEEATERREDEEDS